MNEAVRTVLLAYADIVMAEWDRRQITYVHDDARLRVLRQMRNRLDLAFRQGIGIYSDDYHKLRASVDAQVRELEPPTRPVERVRGGVR